MTSVTLTLTVSTRWQSSNTISFSKQPAADLPKDEGKFRLNLKILTYFELVQWDGICIPLFPQYHSSEGFLTRHTSGWSPWLLASLLQTIRKCIFSRQGWNNCWEMLSISPFSAPTTLHHICFFCCLFLLLIPLFSSSSSFSTTFWFCFSSFLFSSFSFSVSWCCLASDLDPHTKKKLMWITKPRVSESFITRGTHENCQNKIIISSKKF